MRKVLAPGLAALALAAASAACSAGGGDGREGADTPSGATESAAVITGASEAPRDGGGESAIPIDAPALGARVVRTASLEVTVARGRFDETIARARTIVDGFAGFVTGSSASEGGGRLVRGTMVVRVPATAYARAITALERLGSVEGREEAGEDVSGEVVDLAARARHLEAVEMQLLELLDRARTVAAALTVQSRLNEVQLQLEQTRARARYLDDRIAFATITLSVAERGVPVATGGDGFGLGDAWQAAVRGLERVGAGLVVAVVAAGPILAALAVTLIGARALLRRRRARAGAGTSAPTATPPA